MSVETTSRKSGLAYSIRIKDFTLTADVPPDKGGRREGPDPHEYLEVALAGCTAITLQMYADRKGIPLQSVDVAIRIVAEGPGKNEIERDLRLIGDLTPEHKSRLFEIAEKCPLHKFLTAGATIRTKLVE